MSCGLALAFVLNAAAPQAATPPVLLATVSVPAALAQEPLYADIVGRAKSLNLRVKAYQAGPGAASDLASFRAEVEALAALDMQGHLDLKARNVDGDLKCILKGIAEDLPKRFEDMQAARTPEERLTALKEMSYLLNDNVEVITSPPGPATPPPAA
jgi:hypothetical protein